MDHNSSVTGFVQLQNKELISSLKTLQSKVPGTVARTHRNWTHLLGHCSCLISLSPQVPGTVARMHQNQTHRLGHSSQLISLPLQCCG
ncbi:hypothetical protein Y1Q_0020657 [Alligator mississippiensis]|uniref:Uncharacterized protein n=1 Tax=Alligator mississippiensis TaxID=8496 RepID=A0A151NH70_ALLMI|nr:hypothetical protein Y1Q_0020657 [Alligator mississippiensis]